jgi:CheY-like chemotaxis protein
MPTKTVLIADDDADFTAGIARRCAALGLAVRTASDGLDTLMAVMREPPDLAILDINMPAGDGLGVAEKFLKDPKIPPIPVVFCTGRSDAETIGRCQALGAHYVVKGTDTWCRLMPIVCRLLGVVDATTEPVPAPAIAGGPLAEQMPPAARLPKVLFVDDDGDMRRVMQIRLRACGIDVLTAARAMQALWMAMKETPDVIITDYHMPEGSGEYLLARLRGVPMLKDIPVFLLTGAAGGMKRDFALERRFLGEHRCAAFLSKPVDFDALMDALSRHIEIDPAVWRQAAKLRRR